MSSGWRHLGAVLGCVRRRDRIVWFGMAIPYTASFGTRLKKLQVAVQLCGGGDCRQWTRDFRARNVSSESPTRLAASPERRGWPSCRRIRSSASSTILGPRPCVSEALTLGVDLVCIRFENILAATAIPWRRARRRAEVGFSHRIAPSAPTGAKLGPSRHGCAGGLRTLPVACCA